MSNLEVTVTAPPCPPPARPEQLRAVLTRSLTDAGYFPISDPPEEFWLGPDGTEVFVPQHVTMFGFAIALASGGHDRKDVECLLDEARGKTG